MRENKEQHLEALFLQAIEQPVHRPEFLEQLLEGHIYCVGHTDQADDADLIVMH